MSSSKSQQHVLVLGSTGPLGLLIVKELLSNDFQITLLVRTPSKLPSDLKANPKIKIVNGTLESAPTTLFPTLNQYTTIISAMGPMDQKTLGTPLADFYTLLLKSVSSLSTKPKLLILSTPSLRDPNDNFCLTMVLAVAYIKLMAPAARNEILACGKVFLRHGDGIDWTLYRVGILTDEKEGEGLNSDGKAKVAVAGYLNDRKWQLSTTRAQIARWLVGETMHGKGEWVRKMPTLSGV